MDFTVFTKTRSTLGAPIVALPSWKLLLFDKVEVRLNKGEWLTEVTACAVSSSFSFELPYHPFTSSGITSLPWQTTGLLYPSFVHCKFIHVSSIPIRNTSCKAVQVA